MRVLRLAVAAAFLLGFSSAYAFHSGGVAECGGCHAMHRADSAGNIIGATNSNLLANATVSSTCLNCHSGPTLSGYHVMTFPLPAAGVAPANRTPGGDFAWLTKTYSYAVRGSTITYQPGGHAINAPQFSLPQGAGSAPGGSFPTNQLGCSSCHDPHGKARTDSVGNLVPIATNKIIGSGSYPALATPAAGETNSAYGTYRLLYTESTYYSAAGSGPIPATIAGGAVSFSPAPLAVAPSTYNQSENVNQVIVRYGNITGRTVGMWCASCHPKMHTNSGLLVHPIDRELNAAGEDGFYNVYVNSGNKSGAAASSYLSLVPFAVDQNGAPDRAVLAAAATNNVPTGAGPGATDRVMCLSCHRAHASGFQGDIRWEYEGEFLTHINTGAGNVAVWPGTDVNTPPQFARGKTSAETQAAYYDRPVSQFGAYQRSLCNKCHLQD